MSHNMGADTQFLVFQDNPWNSNLYFEYAYDRDGQVFLIYLVVLALVHYTIVCCFCVYL